MALIFRVITITPADTHTRSRRSSFLMSRRLATPHSSSFHADDFDIGKMAFAQHLLIIIAIFIAASSFISAGI